MNGVEILVSEQVVTKYGLSDTTITAMVSIIIVAIVGGLYLSIMESNWEILFFCIIIGIIISFFVGGPIQEATKIPLEYETRYKVTISDEVSMNEFYDKYEIVEQDGKIFTVRERIEEVEK